MDRLTPVGQATLSFFQTLRNSQNHVADGDRLLLHMARELARDFLEIEGMITKDNLHAALIDLVFELGQAEAGKRPAESRNDEGFLKPIDTDKPPQGRSVAPVKCTGAEEGCKWGEGCFHFSEHPMRNSCVLYGCSKTGGVAGSRCR
jgi:hypothetical protein